MIDKDPNHLSRPVREGKSMGEFGTTDTTRKKSSSSLPTTLGSMRILFVSCSVSVMIHSTDLGSGLLASV